MIVLFDVDDVLVEWKRTAIELAGHDAEVAFSDWNRSTYSTARQIGIKDKVLNDLILANPTWWVDLPKCRWADELVSMVESAGIQWYFCTSQSKYDLRSASQKLQWAERHGWNQLEKMCITHQKWLLARPDRILIDDKDSNCEEFCNWGGKSIVFPQPWNAAADHVHRRMEYVRDRLTTLLQESSRA